MKRLPTYVQNIGMVGILALGMFFPGILEMTSNYGATSLVTDESVAVNMIPFAKNHGQFDEAYLFGGSFAGGAVGISDTALTYHVTDDTGALTLREFFIDEHGEVLPMTPEGVEKSSGILNVYRGNDEATWATNEATYTKLTLGEIYEGVTAWLTLYDDEVEKIFEVAPGKNPEMIRMVLDGTTPPTLHIAETGELLVGTSGNIRFSTPRAWQYDAEGNEIPVDVTYRLESGQIYGFRLGSYDVNNSLFIDPIITSRYVQGNPIRTYDIARDTAGNMYVAGNMGGTPLTMNNTLNNSQDGIILKFAPDFTFLSGTFLGGNSYNDTMLRIMIEGSSVYVGGDTASSDFPGSSGSTYGGSYDIVLVELDTDLVVQKSVYIGGSGGDRLRDMTSDSFGNIYVVGNSASSGLPVTAGGAYVGGYDGDGLVVQVDDTLTVEQMRYIGGSATEYLYSAVWDDDVLYIVGSTQSSNFPTASAPQGSLSGSQDMVVIKMDATDFSLLVSSYLGGSGHTEEANGVAVHPTTGDVYLVGRTSSTNFPQANALAGVVTARLDGDTLAPVAAMVVPDTSSSANDIMILNDGNIVILGTLYNYGGSIPTTDGSTHGGVSDVGIVVFSPALDSIVDAAYIGGNSNEYAASMLEDEDGTLVVTGYTGSTNYPVSDGSTLGEYSYGVILTRMDFFDRTATIDVEILPNTANTPGKHMYTVHSSYVLDDGYQVIITIPEEFTGMELLDASDISVTGATITNATISIDDVARTITIVFDASASFTEFVVEIGDGIAGGKNDLVSPTELRSYPIMMEAYHAVGGFPLWSTVSGGMTAEGMYFGVEILEALLMTIDNIGIHLVVDPLHNNGKDDSQYTELTVRSNAEQGYSLYVSLRDTEFLPQLNDGKGNTIASGVGENNFGYMARNASYDSGLAVDADAAFTYPSQAMYSGGTHIGGTTVTTGAGDTHTVYYDLDVDFLPPAGEYQGVITYTVIGDF